MKQLDVDVSLPANVMSCPRPKLLLTLTNMTSNVKNITLEKDFCIERSAYLVLIYVRDIIANQWTRFP